MPARAIFELDPHPVDVIEPARGAFFESGRLETTPVAVDGSASFRTAESPAEAPTEGDAIEESDRADPRA